jgi:hypothetical protein
VSVTHRLTMNDRRAKLAAEITEPDPRDRADLERWLDDCEAQSKRLDEEHMLSGIGRSAAVYMTHEITGDWLTATAGRWYLALPERYMTPDSLRRPDWNHAHYPHDEHGHIGRVTTRERPAAEADTMAERLVSAILADLDNEAR